MSYNPPEAAHTALLRTAHKAELRRVQEAEALEATKVRILGARQADGSCDDSGAPGMLIDKPGAVADLSPSQDEIEQGDPESAGPESVYSAKNSVPKRKTNQQRRKAEKLRAEVRRHWHSTSLLSRVGAPPDILSHIHLLETCTLRARFTKTAARVCGFCEGSS
jgi:hypothetical protein